VELPPDESLHDVREIQALLEQFEAWAMVVVVAFPQVQQCR